MSNITILENDNNLTLEFNNLEQIPLYSYTLFADQYDITTLLTLNYSGTLTYSVPINNPNIQSAINWAQANNNNFITFRIYDDVQRKTIYTQNWTFTSSDIYTPSITPNTTTKPTIVGFVYYAMPSQVNPHLTSQGIFGIDQQYAITSVYSDMYGMINLNLVGGTAYLGGFTQTHIAITPTAFVNWVVANTSILSNTSGGQSLIAEANSLTPNFIITINQDNINNGTYFMPYSNADLSQYTILAKTNPEALFGTNQLYIMFNEKLSQSVLNQNAQLQSSSEQQQSLTSSQISSATPAGEAVNAVGNAVGNAENAVGNAENAVKNVLPTLNTDFIIGAVAVIGLITAILILR